MKHRVFWLIAVFSASPALADPFDFGEQEPAPASIAWRGDIQLRGDAINNIERSPRHDDFRRGLFRLRAGFDWLQNDVFQFAAVGRVNRGSRGNEESRLDYDNELADDESLDELFMRFAADTGTALTFGQAPLPLNLSPALWDNDLRPIGAFLAQDFEFGTFNRLRAQAARFNPNHPFFDRPDHPSSSDETRASAAQLALDIGQGKSWSWHVTATWLEFEALDSLVAEHLTRSNRVTGEQVADDAFVNAFTVADLQVSVRNRGVPLEFSIDVFRNLDAANHDEGGRISLRVGDALHEGGFEIGVAGQRIQRDATVAAFNDDDWWFPTWMRGTRVWAGYGVTEDFSVQVAAFRERRDDWDFQVTRRILDFRYAF